MAKFLQILAASVGGGLVLGAGIRLGEAICASNAEARRGGPEAGNGGELAARLDRVEQEVLAGRRPSHTPRTSATPAGFDSAMAGVMDRMDRQQRDMEAMRRQISDATQALDSAGTGRRDWRGELQRELSVELDRRLEAVEESLHRSLDASNREAVDAMVASIETRLAPRIERIEREVSGQSASVAELRECALQSERSILRLLTALEKSVGAKPRDEAADDSFRLSVVR